MLNNIDFIQERECWVVRADKGKYVDAFREFGIVGLDFDIKELPSEGVEVFRDRQKTYDLFKQFHPNRPNSYPNWWGTFNMFCNRIEVGNVVLSPTNNNDLMVGIVESETYFEEGNEALPHTLRRKVRWMEGVFNRENFPISLQSLHCRSTCFWVVKNKIEDLEEETTVSEPINDTGTEGVVYIMKSNTFENIYKCGYADKDAELRCFALSSDKKYAIFNLEVLGFIKSKSYRRLEKAIHNHFAPIRIWSENGCNIDSELFKSERFSEDFKEYVQLLQKQKYYEISEVVWNY